MNDRARRLQDHRFALAAFLIPLGVQAVPEILVGPYPVGFDTIAFYVPNTLDWAAGKVGVLEMLGTAPRCRHVCFVASVRSRFKWSISEME